MKTLIIAFITIMSVTAQAQSDAIKTETFTVQGNCEDCKERIENAADIRGVKILEWVPETKVATVTYNPKKTNLDKIRKAIADSGYDTGEYKGSEKAYSKLPKCCKYRDNTCEED